MNPWLKTLEVKSGAAWYGPCQELKDMGAWIKASQGTLESLWTFCSTRRERAKEEEGTEDQKRTLLSKYHH